MHHRVLIAVLWLWSSGICTADTHISVEPDDVRLVGGASHCAGRLEVKLHGEWKAVDNQDWKHWQLTSAAEVCRRLNCGSFVSLRKPSLSFMKKIHKIFQPSYMHRLVMKPPQSSTLEVTCLDSIRLVNGTSLCSGRLEVNFNPSNQQTNQSWSSVCQDDFHQQDAEVVCRELECGAPSVLQGALHGEVEAPVWTKDFQCGGHESALLDCDSTVRNTCSPGKAVGLTCSEPAGVRLVGGARQCEGMLEIKQLGEWKPVDDTDWSLKLAGVMCEKLNCGSAVSITGRSEASARESWGKVSDCDASSLMECFTQSYYTSTVLEVTCSDSQTVRLVNGTSLCSGRLEVKFNQSNQWWSSVCEDHFDQQDAQVVCRELGCGAPSVFKGGLYGEVEAPTWTKEFQCGGHESGLLDCRSSGSDRNTCSPGEAVGLTCSDPDAVRLVEGASRCTGQLELKHQGQWKPVDHRDIDWNLKVAAEICRRLDCGSSVSTGKKMHSSERSVWWITSSCVQSNSTLKECVTTRADLSHFSLEVTCTDSVRLVNGTSLCSGRLEMKPNQSNQSWSSVCEDDFDQLDAQVVCRELGCGAPSVLQGALYGDLEAQVWANEFQCGGNESALLDCRSSASTRDTCSQVGLTCSDPNNIRLVGKASRCAGSLELKNQGEWRPVVDWYSEWDQKSAAAICRQLDCGSVVSADIADSLSERLVWWIKSSCVQSGSTLLECVIMTHVNESYSGSEVICSDLLVQPNISLSPSTDGVSKAKQQGLRVLMGSNITIKCSTEPQYPGGSFQLIFTTSNTAQNYTLPAANHSAHFLFSSTDSTHRGEYRCVYHLHVFSHNFSAESQPLSLTVSASLTELIIRLVVLLLGMMLLIAALCFSSKKSGREKNGG